MRNNFKNNLKRFRTSRNISQKQLASDLKVANNTICDWEHGLYEPSFNVVILLAKYFDVSIADLIEHK